MKTLAITAFLTFFVSAASPPDPDLRPVPGVVFEVETTDHSGSDRLLSSRMSVEGKNLKMEILPGSGGSAGGQQDEVIFNGDRRQMVVVNHADQGYMVIDEAAVNQIAGQLGGIGRMMDDVAQKSNSRTARRDGSGDEGKRGGREQCGVGRASG